MKTVYAHACDIIREHRPSGCTEPECIAHLLLDAGLLAPNLPKIKFEVDGGWQENEEKPEIFILTKNLPKRFVGIAFLDHDEKRLTIQVRPVEETREFAHALLAAADHAEGSNEQHRNGSNRTA